MCKFKPGDVILNEHVSERNPIRTSVVYSTSSFMNGQKVYTCLYLDDKKISKCHFNVYDGDNDENFKRIGHIDLYTYLKNELQKITNNELITCNSY